MVLTSYATSVECTQNIPLYPHNKSLSQVDNLFLIASPVTKACLGMAVENQISFPPINLRQPQWNLIPGFLAGVNAPLGRNPIGLSTSPMSTRGSLLCIETRELDLCGFQT